MLRRLFVMGAATGLALLLTAPPGSAQTWDNQLNLTFSGPIQVPGVALKAGTYRFHLVNPDSSRNVMQVMNNEGTQVYAMFHTLPAWRPTVTDDPVVTFKEVPAGAPAAIRTLYYGGEHRGYDFVYPKSKPVTPEPVTAAIAPPTAALPIAEEAPPTPTPAPAAAPEEFVIARAEPTPEPLAAEPTPTAAPELPKTASPLPIAGLFGFTSLIAGLGVGLLRRFHN